MKRNPQAIEKVRKQLSEALVGVESYLNDWQNSPQDFTTLEELDGFATNLREMQESLDKDKHVQTSWMWRIMETWPYQNKLRQKIVEAEFDYQRLK